MEINHITTTYRYHLGELSFSDVWYEKHTLCRGAEV